ncbi:hypothetical protein DRO31_07745 [Candidatus Bathyarchaeota archaeon]|nr:MAG: hypothetical protein DRO31_07745 [Candidatus Bathyarchaeota archaeon]
MLSTVLVVGTVLFIGLSLLGYAHSREEALVIEENSFISLIDDKAILHLRNVYRKGIVVKRSKVEGLDLVEAVDLGSFIGLSNNGLWLDRRAGDVGLNIGDEGYVNLDLSNIVHKMAENKTYTLFIYTGYHNVIRVQLKAFKKHLSTSPFQTEIITVTLSSTT